MTIEWTDAVAVLVLSLAALGIVGFFAFRRSRPVQPVYCVHCWVHQKKVTVTGYTKEGRRWAICQSCVRFYWDFEEDG